MKRFGCQETLNLPSENTQILYQTLVPDTFLTDVDAFEGHLRKKWGRGGGIVVLRMLFEKYSILIENMLKASFLVSCFFFYSEGTWELSNIQKASYGLVLKFPEATGC